MPGFGDQPINFTLVAAVATPRNHIVQVSGANFGGLATSKTQALVGIAMNEPANAGEHLSVCPLGRAEVYCNSAVTLGARITSGASGRAIPAGSGDVIIGYALEAASPGDLFTALINASNDKMIA